MNTKILSIAGLVVLIGFLFGFHQKTSTDNRQIEKGMIKVTILYPNGDGKNFDMDYYSNKHMPMVAGLLGKNLKSYEIDKGIAGRTANDKVPFVAIGYFYISDTAEYNKAIAQNRDKVIGDIKNYTNIQPVIQISEIKELVHSDIK
jgi:uncharacterized protein (TIGR02118 family)